VRRYFPSVEVLEGDWPDETAQRNAGLAALGDCDTAFIVDPDEYYTSADLGLMLAVYNGGCRCVRQRTYWKTPQYRFNPPDPWTPVALVEPRKAHFTCYRLIEPHPTILEDVTLHHFSYVRSDDELNSKIVSYSHSTEIRFDWYQTAWVGWTPGSDVNVWPYRGYDLKAVEDPAPREVVERYEAWGRLVDRDLWMQK